jgi:DNA repair exonuclease SbcCD nuclease subunit
MSGKIAFVSDLHIGKYSNNEKWHQTVIEWSEWFARSLKRNKIKDVVICGDIFDNRSEIGVNTIHTANVVFKNLKEFNLYVLIGNHDSFYKNKLDVNSVCVFDEWPNVEVFVTAETRYVNGVHIQFVPYDCVPKDIKTDIMCGHFDINGFRMNRHKICEGGINPVDLLKHSPLVISGHYHMKDMKTYADGDVLYCGSPFQQDWSESENTSVYCVYDIDQKTVSFVENKKSPKFIKLTAENQITANRITGNIIKYPILEVKTQNELIDIRTKISKLDPFSFDVTPFIDIGNNITQTGDTHTLGDKIDVLAEIEKSLIELDVDKDIYDLVLATMTELYYNNLKSD